MTKFLIISVLALIIIYALIAVVLFLSQRRLLYNPQPPTKRKVNAEEITITNKRIKLRGWVLNPEKRDAVIYFGGKSELIGLGMKTFKKMFTEQAAYFLDYRGYGNSNGRPTEKGMYKDALKIYDTVAAKHENVFVVGRSLGTGVATYLAANRTIKNLILVTPFDSVSHIAKDRYPIFPIDWMIIDKFDSASRAERITVPTLVVYSEEDDVVPHIYTDNLIAALTNAKVKVKTIGDCDHRNIIDSKAYQKVIRSWFLKPHQKLLDMLPASKPKKVVEVDEEALIDTLHAPS